MKDYWTIMLENSVIAICWTFLAYYFEKWWIALFMLMCFTTFKGKKGGDKNE